MKSLTTALTCATATIGLAAGGPAMAQNATTYSADLTALNGSGVSGKVNLRLLKDRYLKVTINATGLETDPANEKLHIAHIHGTFDDSGEPTDAMCPTIAVDDPANGGDGDGFVELGEGATTYGPIIVPLADDVDPDGDGTAEFEMTYDLQDSGVFGTDMNGISYSLEDVMPLVLREIVIHGLTVPAGPGAGTDGEVDGENGYLTVLPVACASIEAKGNGKRQGPKTVNFKN